MADAAALITIPFKSFLEDFVHEKDSPEGLIISNIQDWIETGTKEFHVNQIADNLDPTFLFTWDIVYSVAMGRSKFFTNFRNFFRDKANFQFAPNLDKSRGPHGFCANNLMLHVAREFYRCAGLDEWTSWAIDSLDQYLYRIMNMRIAEDSRLAANASIPAQLEQQAPTHNPNGQQNGNNAQESRRRQASAMSIPYKDPRRCFSGKLGESLKDAVDAYSRLADEQDLDRTQKSSLFYKCLDGNALKYYRDNVENKHQDYASRIAAMQEKFSSTSLHDGNRSKLENLRLDAVARDEKLSTLEALEKIHDTICVAKDDLPKAFRSEAHLVGFYKDAVLAHDFAVGPIERLDQDNLSLQSFHAALVKALNLYDQRQRAKGAKPLSFVPGETARFTQDATEQALIPHSTHFGKYHAPRSSMRPGNKKSEGYNGQRRSSGPCFNCDGAHTIANCDRKIDYRRAAERRLEYFRNQRERKNISSQNAIHFLQDCYLELADVAGDITNDFQHDRQATSDSDIEDAHQEVDFDNADKIALQTYYNSLGRSSVSHAQSKNEDEYDF